MTRAIATLALLGVLSGCKSSTAPAQRAGTSVVASTRSVIVMSDCPGSDVWGFYVDGIYLGLWLVPQGGRLALETDTTRVLHTIEATRWTSEIAVYQVDGLKAGSSYALVCP